MDEVAVNEQLILFWGDTSDNRSSVYAVLDDPTRGESLLRGTLTGPHVSDTRTIPATYPFITDASGSLPVALCLVPDPCFWTPDVPSLYDVQLSLRQGNGNEVTVRRRLGIRRLGVSGRDLWFEGRRWVLRGVRSASHDSASLNACRQVQAVLWQSNPSDALCAEASRMGVLILADLTDMEIQSQAELRRLGRWPAVGVAICDDRTAIDERVARAAAPNLVLAWRLRDDRASVPPSWAKVVLVDAEFQESLERALSWKRPIFVQRKLRQQTTAEEARRACDQLQRDLGQSDRIAGYLV